MGDVIQFRDYCKLNRGQPIIHRKFFGDKPDVDLDALEPGQRNHYIAYQPGGPPEQAEEFSEVADKPCDC